MAGEPMGSHIHPEVRKHLRRNYLLHLIEGGAIGAGGAFIAADSVIPPLLQELGAGAWLISLMPSMTMLGFSLPPLFTAHRIDRLRRLKPFVIVCGFFQRLPVLAAGIVLLACSPANKPLMIAAVALAPLLSGLAIGLSLTAWQGLVAKTVTEARLASLFGLRNVIAALAGIPIGASVTIILGHWPGVDGYGMLHLLSFVLSAVSFVLFCFVREPDVPQAHREQAGFRENLAAMIGIVREDRRLRDYMVSAALLNGVFIAIPYVAIHALAVTGLPRNQVGFFLTAQMAGGIAGNLAAGYAGDRYGGKVVMLAGRALYVAALALAPFMTQAWMFYALFAVLAMAGCTGWVGGSRLSIEIAPLERRATYLTILWVSGFASTLVCSLVGSRIWQASGDFLWLSLASMALVAVSFRYLLLVREPRQRGRPGDSRIYTSVDGGVQR